MCLYNAICLDLQFILNTFNDLSSHNKAHWSRRGRHQGTAPTNVSARTYLTRVLLHFQLIMV